VTIYNNINWTNLENIEFESLQVALAIAFTCRTMGPAPLDGGIAVFGTMATGSSPTPSPKP
jgi:hypothetical protein